MRRFHGTSAGRQPAAADKKRQLCYRRPDEMRLQGRDCTSILLCIRIQCTHIVCGPKRPSTNPSAGPGGRAVCVRRHGRTGVAAAERADPVQRHSATVVLRGHGGPDPRTPRIIRWDSMHYRSIRVCGAGTAPNGVGQ